MKQFLRKFGIWNRIMMKIWSIIISFRPAYVKFIAI